jgi:farnesyl-diphosphate farnesyltransferase
MRLRQPTPAPYPISIQADPIDILRETSRTFYFSIINLPPGLHEAVMSAYLSLRAIDEIEDHSRLDKLTKAKLLRDISFKCQRFGACETDKLSSVLEAYWDELPEVTRRLGEWIALAPKAIASHIWYVNAAMARRMAYWVDTDWLIRTKADLDCYTFSVAGAVGLLLSDLWAWYDGTTSHRGYAVGFGRGLQAVNILRNRAADVARGVNFFPSGWSEEELRVYAMDNLTLADAYVENLAPGPAKGFCRIPLSLAYATLEALARGEPKLSRTTVLEIVNQEGGTLLKT